MATKKLSKTVRSRIKKATESNVFTAIAISSIVLNILLLCAAYVVINPSTYDLGTVKDVTAKYCGRDFTTSDYVNIANNSGQTPAQAVRQRNIACKTSGFAPYYQQAVNAYQQTKK